MEFSERLKNLRKEAGFTQVDVASKLGISQPAYASWERGVKKPTQENLVKIAQIFNVSIDYLVGNSEELTDEEKAIFKKELIDFMEERKKAFEQENYND